MLDPIARIRCTSSVRSRGARHMIAQILYLFPYVVLTVILFDFINISLSSIQEGKASQEIYRLASILCLQTETAR